MNTTDHVPEILEFLIIASLVAIVAAIVWAVLFAITFFTKRYAWYIPGVITYGVAILCLVYAFYLSRPVECYLWPDDLCGFGGLLIGMLFGIIFAVSGSIWILKAQLKKSLSMLKIKK